MLNSLAFQKLMLSSYDNNGHSVYGRCPHIYRIQVGFKSKSISQKRETVL